MTTQDTRRMQHLPCVVAVLIPSIFPRAAVPSATAMLLSSFVPLGLVTCAAHRLRTLGQTLADIHHHRSWVELQTALAMLDKEHPMCQRTVLGGVLSITGHCRLALLSHCTTVPACTLSVCTEGNISDHHEAHLPSHNTHTKDIGSNPIPYTRLRWPRDLPGPATTFTTIRT